MTGRRWIVSLILTIWFTAVSAHANYETTSSFNNLDALTSIQDPNGNSTTYSNNFKGLPTTITDALQKATILTYSGAGRPTSLQDANGNTTSYQYNSKGLLAKEIWPVGAAIRYEYDLGGRVVSKINDSTGATIVSYDYDVLGRVTGRTYGDSNSDSFSYNAAGQLVTASNQNISYTFSYDSAGRLQSQTDNNGNVISYAYDAASRRTSMAVQASGDQHTIGYTYANGKLSTITSNKAGQFGYSYDTLGRRSTVSYPNGIVGTYSYNADQPGWLAGTNYGSAYSVSYPSFDKVGNRTAKYDGIGTSYSYDAVYRLLTSTAGESFSYDNAGNRLTEAGQLYAILFSHD